MSIITLGQRLPLIGWSSSADRLGRVEARRMLRHPAYWFGLAYLAMLGTYAVIDVVRGKDEAWNIAYGIVFLGVCLLYAPLTVISANRVAAAAFRRGVREPLDAAPVDARQRTIGAVLGLLRGPVLVGVVGMALMSVLAPLSSPSVGDPMNNTAARGLLEHLQVPVLVLGAGLLGIALARWAPKPGVLPLVVLVLWFGTSSLYAAVDANGVVHAPTWFAPWVVWAAENAGLAPQQPLGQQMWHLVYLLGLSLLAGVAALLRTPGTRRGLWITAAVTVILTGLAGWQQLG
jgi:hypothetical protein